MHNTKEYISSQIHNAGGYGSEFESDAERKERRESFKNLLPKKRKGTDGVPQKKEMEDEYIKEEAKINRFQILSMDAYARHKKFINDYLLYYGGRKEDLMRDTSKDKTDLDVIRENHRFLWTEDDELEETWETKLAKKYYDKLFKEYCIADLGKYKENKIGMRWRIEKEVVDGKGQFLCGNKKCSTNDGLKSWEVNFGYLEHGEKKNALVKLRLCADCSYRLNYHHKRKEVLPKKKKKKIKELQSTEPEHKKHKSNEENELGEETTQSTRKSSSGDNSESQQEESVWSGPAKIVEEKSRNEEFDDYFEDMFL
ncbi:protein FRA10AC1-like [Gigantopelta aegis]|uniref:protein FRA10AC1-like n=1 Tax=Gigantopelta aegis TaxID=1735272 RepID=UPI001B88835C|nr:protein FRA10AC1-like [Gigantopelta aegis]XP_041370672.1 protein FRA10AC1-like [Gigantopelta aegis]